MQRALISAAVLAACTVPAAHAQSSVTLYGIDSTGWPWEISGTAQSNQWGVRVAPVWAMRNNTLHHELHDLVVTQRYVAPVATFELTQTAIDAGMEVEPK